VGVTSPAPLVYLMFTVPLPLGKIRICERHAREAFSKFAGRVVEAGKESI
jgi:hypothetical protein